MTVTHSFTYQTYYHILGLRTSATLQEIKRAYREKAKIYHPDLNKSPGSQEKFIAVNEAYEFLIRLKSGVTSRKQQQEKRSSSEELFREWMRRERQKARARATEQARKRYEEFRKSKIYRTSIFVSVFYDYLILSVGVFIIIGAILGLLTKPNLDNPGLPEQKITVSSVIATLVLCLVGVVFIVFSGSSIRNRRKNTG